MYEPLPPDKVWLTEPERCDRRSSLEKQCRRTEKRQRECISDNAKASTDRERNRCPPLVELDDSDSDSKSQPEQEADFGLGGENVVDKDLWTDQHVQQSDAEPAPTVSTPIKSPEEVISTEEVTSLGAMGRGLDGRIRRKRD